MYLIALDANPSVLDRMKENDYRSRHTRAGLHLNGGAFGGTPEVRKLLEDFVAQGTRGAKPMNMSDLLHGNQFECLYRTYRDTSEDAAHVSMTSLNRHWVEGVSTVSAS